MLWATVGLKTSFDQLPSQEPGALTAVTVSEANPSRIRNGSSSFSNLSFHGLGLAFKKPVSYRQIFRTSRGNFREYAGHPRVREAR